MDNTSFTENQQLKPITMDITQARIDAYATASGDFNPIHIDQSFAYKSHFGKTIAHGMLIAAMVSNLMSQNFSGLWSESGKLKVRFRAPVFAGEMVTARGYIKKVEPYNSGQIKITCVIEVAKNTADSFDSEPELAITGQASLVGNL